VVSLNLHRRHLTESQRAMIAAKLENMSQGRPEKDANLHDLRISRTEAADLLQVSPRSDGPATPGAAPPTCSAPDARVHAPAAVRPRAGLVRPVRRRPAQAGSLHHRPRATA